MTDAPATLDAFRAVLAKLPGPDGAARAAVLRRNAALTKPAGSLGRLEELAVWYAEWRGVARMTAPQIAIFAGNHGVAAHGVSAYPSEVTAQMVANFAAGGAAINQLAMLAGARLDVLPLALDQPTADFTTGAAMTSAELLEALRAGWSALAPDADLLVPGEMGIGNTTAAAAVAAALTGGAARDWTGPGSGVSGAALDDKVAIVAAGLAFHGGAADRLSPNAVTDTSADPPSDAPADPHSGTGADRPASPLADPFEVLRRLGGREMAAMAGAILGARFARVPVILDGYICCTSAAVLFAMAPGALDHCIAGHRSAEPAHDALLAHLGLPPLLVLDMRLGEGSGGALAIGLVRAALACHGGMATFAEAGVSTG